MTRKASGMKSNGGIGRNETGTLRKTSRASRCINASYRGNIALHRAWQLLSISNGEETAKNHDALASGMCSAVSLSSAWRMANNRRNGVASKAAKRRRQLSALSMA